MNNFEYASPTNVKEAVALLGTRWGETEVLAGGTDLLSLMKEYVTTPKRVVNIKSVQGLSGIRKEGDKVSVGALTTIQDLIDHKEFGKWYPGLLRAAE